MRPFPSRWDLSDDSEPAIPPLPYTQPSSVVLQRSSQARTSSSKPKKNSPADMFEQRKPPTGVPMADVPPLEDPAQERQRLMI